MHRCYWISGEGKHQEFGEKSDSTFPARLARSFEKFDKFLQDCHDLCFCGDGKAS